MCRHDFCIIVKVLSEHWKKNVGHAYVTLKIKVL